MLLACLFICGCPLLLTPVGSYLCSNLAFRFLIYLAVWSKIWPSGFLFFWPSGFGRLDKFGLRTQLELETLKHTSFLASSWLKNKQFETKNLCTHAPTIEYKFDRLLCILPTFSLLASKKKFSFSLHYPFTLSLILHYVSFRNIGIARQVASLSSLTTLGPTCCVQ